MIEKKIAVIGSGISGLTTAWKAQSCGVSVDIFDSKQTTGGVIRTENDDGWRYELGPNTLLLRDAEIEELLESLGLTSRIEVANQTASKRFIVKDGKLEALPQSLKGFLKTPLFSARAKARLLTEPFIGKSSPDASIAEFFEARFGKEVLDYAVNPFIAGIHAGRPEKLSVRHAFPALHKLEASSGSVILGGLKKAFRKNGEKKVERRLISFKTGLHELPEALSREIPNQFMGHSLQQTDKRPDGWYVTTSGGEYGPYRDVVMTIPIHKWRPDMLPLNNQQAQILSSVQYPPLSMLILGYKKEAIEHPLDGFGFLVPEVEKRSVLGALFTSTLFNGRAPEGHHLLTVFAGGARQPNLAHLDSETLLKLVEDDLNELIGLKGTSVYKQHIFWPNSIPQYETGYDKVYSILDDIEQNNPGLHFAGNFRHGISVPDCIKNGLKLGRELGDN